MSSGQHTIWHTPGEGRMVHLCGVCGVGMAGLAALLATRGWRVSGCDCAANNRVHWLKERGISVLSGHSPSHVTPATTALVRSAAVPSDHPEVEAATRAGIPVWTRGRVLPRLLDPHLSIAIAGTHGKTTTSSFVAHILRYAGVDPSWCVGWETALLGAIAHGEGAGPCVVEADESDGTLAEYVVGVGVVTNLDFDHMEHFMDEHAFRACFAAFVEQVSGRVVYCGDDEQLVHLMQRRGDADKVSYGFAPENDVHVEALEEDAEGSRFVVVDEHGEKRPVHLPVAGRYNVLNGLAALCAAREFGVALANGAAALAVASLPGRRFERVYDRAGIQVISDYAHHPTEIGVLLETALLQPAERRIALFQPHRYSRTAALVDSFAEAFAALDLLVLVPVYAASEPVRLDGTVWELYRRLRMPGRDRPGMVFLAGSPDAAWRYLRQIVSIGDQLLVIGAGDVDRIARQAARELAHGMVPLCHSGSFNGCEMGMTKGVAVHGKELAGQTTLGVGGHADLYVEPADESELALVLRYCSEKGLPVTILGGGSNVVVSDIGVRGVTLRLSAPSFSGLSIENDVICAGTGVSLARLVAYAGRHGRAGFEFLCGIPGTVGGALRMNAGAWGCDIAERVKEIRCLNTRGELGIVTPSLLHPGYRCMAGLTDRVVVSACFKTESACVAEQRRRLQGMAYRRGWQRGMRTCGSVFKNPPGDYAGRIIEAAGLKGFTVGGVRVSERHANFFEASEHATASDVLALIALVRGRVAACGGGWLDPEVCMLGGQEAG